MTKQYETSAEFTDDFYTAIQKLREASDIFSKPEMAEWFKITDFNYLTRTQYESGVLLHKLRDALAQADVIDEELRQAE
jgi:hypothetical protein